MKFLNFFQTGENTENEILAQERAHKQLIRDMNISHEADIQKRNALSAEEVSHEISHFVTLMC